MTVTTTFLDGATVVAAALDEPAVAEAWDRPSVLEEQTIGGLAGHLARTGIWIVGDYLDAEEPAEPVDYESASEYYADVLGAATDDLHRAVRERGAAVAAAGAEEVAATARTRLAELQDRLPTLDPAHRVAVLGGKVMRLEDYLVSRILEQVVHLDDLARSLDREPWPLPAASYDLVFATGVEIGRRLQGDTPMLRALYRRGFGDAMPVL